MAETTNSRRIFVENHDGNKEKCFPDNSITTSKYTIWTFLPKSLFEQFRKAANIYFALISVLSALPTSPKDFISLVGTFAAVLLFSALKEGIEDISRHKQDRFDNNKPVQRIASTKGDDVLRQIAESNTAIPIRSGDKSFNEKFVQQVPCSDVHVGHLVIMYENELVPADMVLLATSDEKAGYCFVDTSNLDGESNLKVKAAVHSTNSHANWVEFAEHVRDAVVMCEEPNPVLYHFHGVLELRDKLVEELQVDQLLLRGTRLRNTAWAVGVIVNTGHETKMMMNASVAPSKVSSFELKLNKCLFSIFAVQALVCSLNTAFAFNFLDIGWITNPTISNAKYSGNLLRSQLFPSIEHFNATIFGLESFFTFVVTYSNIIPISLYVAVEVVKITQKYFIDSDLDLYHEESGTFANSRTSNLIGDLGQVEYVFTDKTGTLTQNEMVFHSCSVDNNLFKTASDKTKWGMEGSLRRTSSLSRIQYSICQQSALDQHRCGGHTCMCSHLSDMDRGLVSRFWTILALCHSCIARTTKTELSSDVLKVYEGESPDDVALVSAAQRFGYQFLKRDGNQSYLRVEEKIHGETMHVEKQYEEIVRCPFTSDRKRMSVVVRCSDNVVRLMLKGADEVVLPLIRNNSENAEQLRSCNDHLLMFSRLGLRTLCLAEKELEMDEWEAWLVEYQEAKYRGDEARQSSLFSALETDLDLVGVTAIEDRLQKGVPETIRKIREARVRIWMLTGDKEETAINIGYASELIDDEDSVVISLRKEVEDSLGDKYSEAIVAARRYDGDLRDASLQSSIADVLRVVATKVNSAQQQGKTVTVVVTGAVLGLVFRPKSEDQLLGLLATCNACICCRVSPKQKAEMVRLVRKKVKKITLAIGDGGNDVPMIQEAHIGIGVSGLEGMQAVRASDYSISQFRFLKKLLLVHGRWGYRRLAKFTLYYFYKNVVVSIAELMFAYYSMFSGQVLFADWFSLLYNAGYTSYPCIITFALEKDLSMKDCLKYPELYTYRRNEVFSLSTFLRCFANGVIHGVLCYLIPTIGMESLDDGKSIGLWFYGTTVFHSCILVVTIKLMLETRTWTTAFTFILALNIVAYLISLIIFDSDWGGMWLQNELWSLPSVLTKSTGFWSTSFLMASILAILHLSENAIQQILFERVEPHVDLIANARKSKRGRVVPCD